MATVNTESKQLDSDKVTERHPGYGQLSLTEWIGLMVKQVYTQCVAVPRVLIRRAASYLFSTPKKSDLPETLAEDILLESTRTIWGTMTIRQGRYLFLPHSSVADRALSSPRYSSSKSHIFSRVDGESFTGYWIRLPDSKPPEQSDAVIYAFHGGAYATLRPHHYMTFYLRLLEALKHKYGLNVSTFALDYSLTPEAVFPEQLKESAKAWQYLVQELGISPDKVMLAGDSAGGHLALSLLAHLADPHPSIPGPWEETGKPGSAMLLSPWTTLRTSSVSYTTNRWHDVLDPRVVAYYADVFRGPTPSDDPVLQRYTEFTRPAAKTAPSSPPPRDWKKILPQNTWVGAGELEVYVSDIVDFANDARGSGAEVELRVETKTGHAAWTLESLVPGAVGVDEFLTTKADQAVGDKVLPLTEGLAQVVAELIGKGI